MSTGNPNVDQMIANAAGLLNQKWWNPATARQAQPENDLAPDTAQLQFRIKQLEDRADQNERRLQQLERALNVRGR